MKRIILLAILVLASTIGIGKAQDDNPVDLWASIWLYLPDAGKMTLLSTEGTTVLPEFFPMIPSEYDVKPHEIALSPDGISLAFGLRSSTTGKQILFELSRSENGPKIYEPPNNVHLSPRIVFHNTGAIRASAAEAYNPILGFTSWMQMKIASDATLAFGDTTDSNFWKITVYDPLTDEILHTLNQTQARNLNPKLDWPLSASLILQAYNDDTVIFSLLNSQSAKAISFNWNTADNSISSNVAYRAKPEDLDSLPDTGEVIAAVGDTLYVYDPKQDESFVFYRAPGELLRLPRFVENGKRVAFVTDNTLYIMNRDGSEVVTAGPPPQSIVDMAGTPSGLVFLSAFDDFTMLGNLGLINDDSFLNQAVLWSTPKHVSAHILLAQSGVHVPSQFDTPWAKLASPSETHK